MNFLVIQKWFIPWLPLLSTTLQLLVYCHLFVYFVGSVKGSFMQKVQQTVNVPLGLFT